MERVVITGLGVVSSIGIGREEFWNELLAGSSGISDVTYIDTTEYANHRGGQIKKYEISSLFDSNDKNTMERGSAMAVKAAEMAVEDSKLVINDDNRYGIGVAIGTTMGEIQTLEKLNRIRIEQGVEKIPSNLLKDYAAVNIPANIAKTLSINGRNIIIPNACAAGSFALTYAFELIRSKKAEAVLAGGVDPFSKIAFTGFHRLGAMSPDVVRSYDKNSRGMMVGEGAGILVIESLSSALKRAATIYAEIVGYGITCDAKHITAPDTDGMIRAMTNALGKANIGPEQIDAVIGHGTGTPSNDQCEMKCIGHIFGERKDELPVTSVKSILGHTMGAASGIEALTNALMVKNDVIPPTLNFQEPHEDKSPKIRIVANQFLQKKIHYSMNNALAFGGNNASIILKKFEEE